jgi:hypothetical protein
MSQVVYTELEGQPLRWEYKGVVPRESRQEASRTPTTWSALQTNTNQKGNTTTSAAMDVYGSNQVGGIIKTPANAVRTNQIQVYGLKAGTPPSPLNIEIRKTRFSNSSSGVVNLLPNIPDPYDIIISETTEIPIPAALQNYYDFVHVGRIDFRIKRVGSPSDITVRLVRNDNVVVSSQTVSATSISTTAYTTISLNMSYNASFTNNTYIIRFEMTGDASNYYLMQGIFYNTKTTTADFVNETPFILIPTKLPAGKRVILVTMGHNGGGTFRIAKLFLRKADNTLIGGTWDVANAGIQLYNGAAGGFICFDANGALNETYLLNVKDGLNNYFMKVIAFNVDDGDTNSATATVAAGATSVIASKNTTLQGGNYVVMAMLEVQGGGSNVSVGANTVRIKVNGVNVSSNEFSFTSFAYSGAEVMLVYASNLSDNPTIAVEFYNSTTTSLNVKATWIAFKVPDFYYIDGASTSVGTTDTTLVNLTTTYLQNTNVVVIASCQSNTGITFTIKTKMNNTNEFIYPPLTLAYNPLSAFHFYTVPANNPSFQVTAAATATGTYSGEAKLAVFSLPANNIWTGYIHPTIFIKGLEPEEKVLASGSISASSVGTTAAWIAINLSSPIVLRPNEYYALVAYTIGGDATNKYQLYKGGQVGNHFEHLLTSSNSGGSWTIDTTTDLSYQVMGYSMTRIYNGSISDNIVTPLGKVVAALIVKAQTSGTMEFAGFDDHTLTSSPVSSTAASQTLITVLASDAPRLRDVAQSTTLNWEIWAAGTGLATVAYTQRHTYYTTNPVYPKDFGFGELYLIADEIPPQGLIVLNDNTAAALYNSSTTATRVDSYELFRVSVRKIEVIQEPTSGRIVMYLIGLP